MLTALKDPGNHRPAMLAAGLLLCVLSAPVLGDEFKYLPDKTRIVQSYNVPAILKSKTYREMKKQNPEQVRRFEDSVTRFLGIPPDNIARLTMAWGPTGKGVLIFGGSEDAVIVTTINPIKAATILENTKPRQWGKEKVGTSTIHIGLPDGELRPPEFYHFFNYPPFFVPHVYVCVVEEKIVLLGTLSDWPLSVLERKKQPELSAGVKAALKMTSATDLMSEVVEHQDLASGYDLFFNSDTRNSKLKFLAKTVSEDEGGKLKIRTTLVCKANAPGVKKDADLLMADHKAGVAALLSNPRLAPSRKDGLMAMRVVLDSVKISAEEDNVIGQVELAPDAVAKMHLALYRPTLDLETTKELPTELLAKQGEKATWEILNGPIERVVPTENKQVTATFTAHSFTLTVGAGAKAGDRAEFVIQSGAGKVMTKISVTFR